ncbi:membrane protein [Streptomyces viridochromogenes DSM 40736]|uniref:Membrane protein n=1 Tax=Streptomyces viridochromogenes (strain DSM 40736 / JCM 4977 / BCRC 1201 / Tue 494) TaxID=591159 RepID=D9XIX2_STRVT|nr:membrane protein [Streptomyces viridochromogenes DSM 40736]
MPRIDDRQGPGATAEIPAVPRDDNRQGPGSPADFGTGAPQHADPFVRPDVFGAPAGRRDPSPSASQYPAPQSYDNGSTGQYPAPRQDNGATGQYPAPQSYDNGSTGQFPAPRQDNGATGQFPAHRQDGNATGQYPAARQDNGSGRPTLPGPATPADPTGRGQYERPQVNGARGDADFGAPRPPARQEPEALPPASGPGDGRTPLYDTLETNWFHGAQQEQQNNQQDQREQQDRQPQSNGSAPAPQQPQGPTGPQRSAPAGWRSSPNDDLVRQAERVRQPAAGGITTSGLPRRVPRANLVPGTAQQQPQQSGPQISRAPDDVRGRLTNLRRGIAQGRQAGSTQTGSYPRPSHQQER